MNLIKIKVIIFLQIIFFYTVMNFYYTGIIQSTFLGPVNEKNTHNLECKFWNSTFKIVYHVGK